MYISIRKCCSSFFLKKDHGKDKHGEHASNERAHWIMPTINDYIQRTLIYWISNHSWISIYHFFEANVRNEHISYKTNTFVLYFTPFVSTFQPHNFSQTPILISSVTKPQSSQTPMQFKHQKDHRLTMKTPWNLKGIMEFNTSLVFVA